MLKLAQRGELRRNFEPQVRRLLASPKLRTRASSTTSPASGCNPQSRNDAARHGTLSDVRPGRCASAMLSAETEEFFRTRRCAETAASSISSRAMTRT